MNHKIFNDIKVFVVSYRNDYEKRQIEKRLRSMLPLINECENNPDYNNKEKKQ